MDLIRINELRKLNVKLKKDLKILDETRIYEKNELNKRNELTKKDELGELNKLFLVDLKLQIQELENKDIDSVETLSTWKNLPKHPTQLLQDELEKREIELAKLKYDISHIDKKNKLSLNVLQQKRQERTKLRLTIKHLEKKIRKDLLEMEINKYEFHKFYKFN